ncbi:MAG: YebC/PmpR family DNA-binding transcriptional regulator [Planctomycetes bacterium]|jgi:YebC/PmpR family DNA-binding regulatory protein|nr:YebC/PmpR family DNA-binding transcriptional regulator [Planctomycetota bacterium]
MSGHSKWATTKRQKAVVDAKKGAVFTRVSNLITIAAREKGGDIATNFMLRMAVEKARAANMPKDNIERAIKRGTGELGGAAIEELMYEGFGPGKAQFIIKSLTDNKNRSASNIRHLFTKYGGSFGTVAWNFSEQGVIRIEKLEVRSKKLEDESFELSLIDAGAGDIENEEEGMTIYTEPCDLQKVKQMLEDKGTKTETAGIEYVAKDKTAVVGADRESLEKFIEELEDSEDVSDYYTNAII